MNYKARVLAVLVATAAAPFAMAASDGTINFTGEVKDATCTVTVNGVVSPAVSAVKLPTVSVSNLATVNATAGRTGFNIELSNCSANAKTASAFFEPGNSVDSVSGLLKNVSGKATKVNLQLLDGGGAPIKAGDTSQTLAAGTAITAAGITTLPYSVQYIATGTGITPGTVISSVTYSINYQ